MTPLDHAQGLMNQNPDSTAHRLRFFERLCDTELFLMIQPDSQGDKITPVVFPTEGQDYVLVFDTEDRMVEFTGKQTPFAALPGRDIATMLAGQEFGMGVNLGDEDAGVLLPAKAIDWLAQILGNQAEPAVEKPRRFSHPFDATDGLEQAITDKLKTLTGLARSAYLVGVTYESGWQGNLLGFVNALEVATDALKQAATDIASFSSSEVPLDIAFFNDHGPIFAELEKLGLRFDVPILPTAPARAAPVASGMDPDNPPRLK